MEEGFSIMDELKQRLERHISSLNKKIARDKSKAYWFKLISLILTFIATVALGYEGAETEVVLLKNTALFCTAGIAFFNGIDMYYNHKGLWVQYVVTRNKLYEISDDLAFERSCNQGQISEERLKGYHQRIQTVLDECNEWWVKERGRDGA
ncbi:SLATT domain-containing protein [Vibrio parahaemolyticus]|uniref:SLATT domain-containing protein n=1 Tax=Vibrio parahaemolyticus TaxID=670 RepID=UPI002362B3B6|nr:SLATT domain-containing protein [Vibrio parahaemolyticus]